MLVHEGEISMLNIGCDIGKHNLDVYIGGKHKKFSNTIEGIDNFVEICAQHTETRVILEPSGGYEKKLVNKLFENNIQVSVVNPYYVRNFAKSYRDLAKTDKIDAKMLSEYGEKMDPRIQERKEAYRIDLEELTERRNTLVEVVREEKQRLEKEPKKLIIQSIEAHVEFLKQEIRNSCNYKQKKINEINKLLTSEKGIGEQTAAILIA